MLRQQISRLHSHNAIILKYTQRRLASSSSGAAKRTISTTTPAAPGSTAAPKISPAGSASPQAIPVPGAPPAVPIWQRLGPLTWAIQGFGRSQRKRPYLTQFISTLVIYFLGDMSAQAIRMQDEKSKAQEARAGGLQPDTEGNYEPERTAKALIIGAGSSIPAFLW